MAAKVETGEQLVERLRELEFFEGYTPQAQKEAEDKVRSRFDEAMHGPERKYYERFPAYAAIFLSVIGEWDGEPFEELVEAYVKATFGMFEPTEVKDVRNEVGEGATLSFMAGGKKYSATCEYTSVTPTEFMELLEQAVADTCNGLRMQGVLYPEPDECAESTLCTNKAFEALLKAKLVTCDVAESIDADWE